jgi:D-alanine--poly(phosphoribitol) ligase subunit 2
MKQNGKIYAMNANELEREIRSFLEQELLVTFDESITPETDLFKAGVIESRNYLAIIKFLQSRLGVEMTDEDLFMNVLVSLSGILEFAKGKLQP